MSPPIMFRSLLYNTVIGQDKDSDTCSTLTQDAKEFQFTQSNMAAHKNITQISVLFSSVLFLFLHWHIVIQYLSPNLSLCHLFHQSCFNRRNFDFLSMNFCHCHRHPKTIEFLLQAGCFSCHFI